MKRSVASGFKTQPSVYKLSNAPTGRARCRGRCKLCIDKGDLRLEICVFVRPGRRTVRLWHVSCLTEAIACDVLRVYGSVKRVPVGDDVCAEKACDALALIAARANREL